MSLRSTDVPAPRGRGWVGGTLRAKPQSGRQKKSEKVRKGLQPRRAKSSMGRSAPRMGDAIMNELRILVAEDMQDDVVLLKHAFQKAGVGVALHFVTDGQEAVDYLNGAERYANRAEHPLPTLLLLDLNMPRLNGFDVLEWLRQQPGLR